jgi:hypothetical protein
MITIRRSDERGHFDHGWLDTRHTFSFAGYRDPAYMGFRSLRVINEDRVRPGAGFGAHGHDNMEIITYLVDGGLAHRDSAGHEAVIRPGDVQVMSAGSGIEHSEYNASPDDAAHLLQIWIRPDRRDVEPAYADRTFAPSSGDEGLRLLASRGGRGDSLPLHQDADVYRALLAAGSDAELELRDGRAAWVQVVAGELAVNGQSLAAGDGAAIEGEPALHLAARTDIEALLFDLA